MATTRQYAADVIEQMAQEALDSIAARREQLWEEAIADHIETQNKYRLERSKFSLFNLFPRKYVEETRAEAEHFLKLRHDWFMSTHTEIFDHNFKADAATLERVLVQARDEAYSKYITVDSADYKVISKWRRKS